jgi:two-component system chemotaxis response regulator CheY
MTENNKSIIRVMVIDDNTTMRSIVRYQLNQMGVTDLIEASNGKDALSKLLDPGIRKPHAILCDLHMDQMDGLEFCNFFRNDKELKATGIPIIIVTADGERFTHEVAHQVGAHEVLTKPFTTAVLQRELEQAIGFQFGDQAA